MKNKYLNEEGIREKYDKRQKRIDGISIALGASGPVAAVGSYILGSNMSGEAYGAIILGTPAVAGVFDGAASKINQKKKRKALENYVSKSTLETHEKSGIPLQVARA